MGLHTVLALQKDFSRVGDTTILLSHESHRVFWHTLNLIQFMESGILYLSGSVFSHIAAKISLY